MSFHAVPYHAISICTNYTYRTTISRQRIICVVNLLYKNAVAKHSQQEYDTKKAQLVNIIYMTMTSELENAVKKRNGSKIPIKSILVPSSIVTSETDAPRSSNNCTHSACPFSAAI